MRAALVFVFFALCSAVSGPGALMRSLPGEVKEVLSVWGRQLRSAEGTVTFSAAVNREAYVVDKVQRGDWPPEVRCPSSQLLLGHLYSM